MPSYTVQSPAGQSLTITGDTPPTEKELDDIFAQTAPADTPAPVQPAPAQKPMPRNPRTGLPDLREVDKFGQALGSMADLGLKAGGPALGQAIGGATGPLAPVAVPVLGAIGGAGGDALAQWRAMANGDQPGGFRWGELAASAGMGVIPGGFAARGGTTLAKQAVQGAATNLTGKYVETAIDEGRIPTPGEALGSAAFGGVGGAVASQLGGAKQLAQLSPEEALLIGRTRAYRDLRPFKIVVPPSDLGKGSDMIGGIGGAAPTRYTAIAMNQPGWQAATRQDLPGLPGVGPIFPEQYQAYRKTLAAPYQKIAAISERAQAQLENLRAAGPRPIDGPSTAAFGDYNKSIKNLTDPLMIQAAADIKALPGARIAAHQAMVDMKNQVQGATYDKWQGLKGAADDLEDKIQQAAVSAGNKDLARQLKQSRRLISKSYLAQAATNPDNGLVSPKAFGDVSWEAGTRGLASPLDGNFKKMGAFYNNFDRLGKEVTSVPAPGVNQLNSKLSWMNIPALVHGSLGKPARAFMLSEGMQNKYASPFASTFGNDLAAETFRQAALIAGRDDEPLSEQELSRLEELKALQGTPANANP